MKIRMAGQHGTNKGGGNYSKRERAVNPHSPPASTDGARWVSRGDTCWTERFKSASNNRSLLRFGDGFHDPAINIREHQIAQGIARWILA